MDFFCGTKICQIRCLGAQHSFLTLRLTLALGIFLMLSFTFIDKCRAAQDQFAVKPGWLRPGRSVSVFVPEEAVNVLGKVFLRVNSSCAAKDLPLDVDQLRKGLVQVTIPAPMDRGIYDVFLVREDGKQLGSNQRRLIIGGLEAPVITKIVPGISFPNPEGTYDFAISGEKFGQLVETLGNDLEVKINGIPIGFKKRLFDKNRNMSVNDCEKCFPCLIRHWRSLRIFGYKLEDPIHRPLNISVEVDHLVSDKKQLLLSPVPRWVPVTISWFVPTVLFSLVWFWSRKKAVKSVDGSGRFAALTFLLVEPQTTTYSLSRLQLILWTFASVVSYVYLASSQFLVQGNWQLPGVPEGLPALLGLSAGTTVLSVFTTETRGSKGAGVEHPGISDFFTTGSVFAPERFQFFVWTILGVIGFIVATFLQDPTSVHDLPKIPDNFLILMGASSLGYLGGKFTRKPGPVIKQVDPEPPYPPGVQDSIRTIRVFGENLSPRAQVKLNGTPLPAECVNRAPNEPTESEFVRELVLTPKTFSDCLLGKASLSVINPDGQIAETG